MRGSTNFLIRRSAYPIRVLSSEWGKTSFAVKISSFSRIIKSSKKSNSQSNELLCEFGFIFISIYPFVKAQAWARPGPGAGAGAIC